MKKRLVSLLLALAAVLSLAAPAHADALAENILETPRLHDLSNASNGVTVTWDPVEGASLYRIYYKSSGRWAKLTDTVTNRYTWTGAEVGVSYSFTVCCLRPDGKGLACLFDRVGKSIVYQPDTDAQTPAIVEVARTQLGNVGGEPYWSWYGYSSRVEWCAIFISWCADICGALEAGDVPMFQNCVLGSDWYMENERWQDRSYTPSPGDIVFFDWEGDGLSDHVGIVEHCEDGVIYTVEGNSHDVCCQKQYPVGCALVYGYGLG